MKTSEASSPFGGRLLVVGDRNRLLPLLRGRYSTLEVATAPSYLSGIAELRNGPVQGIVAYVDSATEPLDRAIRGLRMAVGDHVPLILCCDPETEPLARQALPAGANDYLIFPPDPVELDQLLLLQSTSPIASYLAPPTNEEEMLALSRALFSMSVAPQTLLQKLAELLLLAVQAQFVRVLADGISSQVGESSSEEMLRETIMREEICLGEIILGKSKQGTYTRLQLEKLRHYASLFGQILFAAKRQHELQRLATTDELTGLPNRRYGMEFLDRVLQQAATERTRVTVGLFDIDDFKKYNDQFGHAAGDEILKETAQLFLKHCRSEDVVARIGGDEFLVIFWDYESPRIAGSQHPDQAMAVMRRFQKSLYEHHFSRLGPGSQGVLTISGGLATYPWDATGRDDLLERADQALLDAKKHGKNCIHLLGGSFC